MVIVAGRSTRSLGITKGDSVAKRMRRSYRELFMDKLKELSGDEQKLIGNITLREALGWDESRYNRIKDQLREENSVIVGMGRGGSVGLARAPGSKALAVFISYSHRDEDLKDRLVKHLEPLKRLNLIESWHDRKLMGGDNWGKEISENLDKADIVLLLISVDFITSSYCYDIELERALERHANEECVVIPVILRNCLWQHLQFSKLQALPKDGKAVCAWTDHDEAFTNVAEGVRTVAEKLRALR
jgi:TIR domain-containing protein